jgi:adenosylmethionine-8-amino-7-oxononanoate aminotransferase
MSVGDRSPFSAPFAPYLFEVEFIPFPEHTITQSIFHSFTQLAQSGDVAAFIYEPLVQGAAGMRMYSPAVLNTLLTIAKENNIVCIADEVMTGFGRTGELFASQYCDTQPDIMCLSKGLTGGTMALGVTTCTEEIMCPYRSDDLMKTFFHGHSFTANPIACAAANASLDLLLTDECQENIKRISEKHTVFLRKITGHPSVIDARSKGVILAIEVKTSADTSYFNEVRNSLYDYFIARNILLRPLGNIVYILPPYIITNEELDIIYAAILELLNKSKA